MVLHSGGKKTKSVCTPSEWRVLKPYGEQRILKPSELECLAKQPQLPMDFVLTQKPVHCSPLYSLGGEHIAWVLCLQACCSMVLTLPLVSTSHLHAHPSVSCSPHFHFSHPVSFVLAQVWASFPLTLPALVASALLPLSSHVALALLSKQLVWWTLTIRLNQELSRYD